MAVNHSTLSGGDSANTAKVLNAAASRPVSKIIVPRNAGNKIDNYACKRNLERLDRHSSDRTSHQSPCGALNVTGPTIL